MTEYLVTWRIFVEARTPEEAALAALAAQRSLDSTATCFDVCDEAGHRNTVVCSYREEAMRLPQGEAPAGPQLKLVKTSSS